MSGPDRLQSDRLRADLGQVTTIGSEIVVLEETESTNDAVRDMAAKGCPEGLVVFAEYQTAGRGQRENRWVSAPGKALCFSVLLRPELPIEDSARLTQWAAETVAATIQSSCGIEAVIKSPNDIYVRGRKVAGVLVEMKAQPRAAHLAVLGIGLNVNQAVEDFPLELRERATSLAIVTGSRQDRHPLAVALLRDLDQTYQRIARR